MASKTKAKPRRKAVKAKSKKAAIKKGRPKIKVVKRDLPTTVGEAIGVVESAEPAHKSNVLQYVGNNEFSLDVARMMPKKGNYFVSPFNMRTALAMLYAGARTATAKEMADVLAFPEDQKILHLHLSALKEKLEATGVIKMGNSIWVDEKQPVELLFRKVLEVMYKARMGVVNFEGNPEGCRAAINQWVEDATEKKIKDLMPPQSVTDKTRMVLVAAIHFKDAWEKSFDPAVTQTADFFAPEGVVRTPLMNVTGNFGYAKGPNYKILEMPYKSGLSMFIILPDANDGLPALEEDLLLGKIQLPHKLDEPKVRVTFPKFKVEHSLPATEMLKELGMGLAFDDKADFSGISHGDDALKVSSVIHKAFCEVNEEGTEAAAATAVVMVRCMSFTPEPQPEVFRADHPFLYMIRENEGNILFMGRMENPKG
jgi:serpin B